MADKTEQARESFMPPLEVPCAACKGKGGETDESNEWRYDCIACDGTGFVLTPAGRELFSFLQHAGARLRHLSQA
jgi:hypothetical protein